VYKATKNIKLISIMKKTIIIGVFICLATAISVFAINISPSQVKGWFLAGSYPAGYTIGVENNAERNGHVAFLKSIQAVSDTKFGTIMQSFIPDDYLSKRVKLTGYIKTEDVKGWAGMWFRVDGDEHKTLAFDNMQNRMIKGTTEWKKYEIVLDVPANSKNISYGVLLAGSGNVWLDDLSFDVVLKDAPETNLMQQRKPQNTNFEEPVN
jgi:hypothetical protein